MISGPGFEGRDSVAELHRMVFEEVSDVEYTHELGDETTRILVANAKMLGKPYKGTLLLELNPDGKIREIWVMVRPLTGSVAIARAIGAQLAKRRGPGRGPTIRALTQPLAGMARMTDRIGSRLIDALNRSTG